jgi:hypothetical protein
MEIGDAPVAQAAQAAHVFGTLVTSMSSQFSLNIVMH